MMLMQYLWRRAPINLQPRRFSTSNFGRDNTYEQSIEQEAEGKVGRLLKLIFAGTATVIGYQIFPYMGDNLMQQSVSLLQFKDPFFKRMDEAAVVLHQAGAISIINSTPKSAENAEVGKYKSNLLSRFQNLSYDVRS